jgi:DUF917 family protein
MRELGVEAIADIAAGAAVLGTGGGGNPYIGRLLVEQAIRRHGPVTVVDIDEVPPDAFIIPTAEIGAPTVSGEKPPSGDEGLAALAAIEQVLGQRATHTVSIEAGGMNSLIPLATAAARHLPVVDGDGMGRAFPEVQMVLFTVAGVSATPLSLADEKGNTLVVDAIDNRWAERFARTATVQMGCRAMMAPYAMSGEQLARGIVPGTLTLCEELGRLLRATRLAHEDPVAAVTEKLDGRRLFDGKVVDVERRTLGGFARGTARIDGSGPDADHELTLHFQNENLLAEIDGEAIACTPDLIIVLDREHGSPITTETLRYGCRVSVVGAPADPRWHTPEGLALVGPEVFGYDVKIAPLAVTHA